MSPRLSECWPQASAAAALARVSPPMVQALLDFAREGFAPLQARYAGRDALAGREVSTSEGLQGVALGVGAGGALRLQLPGRVLELVSDEVSVRPV